MNDRTIVYIFLSGFALYFLKEGILLYVEDATIFHESEFKLEDLSDPIEWPDLQVCSSPSYKSKDKLKEFESKSTSFQDENEYNTYAEAAFFTKVNEILTAINIGFIYDYMDILNNTNTIPLEEPYVKSTIIDLANYGYCATISFNALKQHMIAQYDLSGNEKDISFYTAIWPKVS